MLIKKKSLIVVLVSVVMTSSVLVLTLVGYFVYIEIKAEEFRMQYQTALRKVNAKVYSKRIEVSKLNAKIGPDGPLKGKPVIEGSIKNAGARNISSLLMKVKFLDRDGAVIYEMVFDPQEPSLGTGGIAQVNIPYIYSPAKIILRPNDTLSFKKVMTNCPIEIAIELSSPAGFARAAGRWSGRLDYEILSLEI